MKSRLRHVFFLLALLSLQFCIGEDQAAGNNPLGTEVKSVIPKIHSEFGVLGKAKLRKEVADAYSVNGTNIEVKYYSIASRDDFDLSVGEEVGVIGFESFVAEGVPRLSAEVSAKDGVALPAGPSYHVRHIYYVVERLADNQRDRDE